MKRHLLLALLSVLPIALHAASTIVPGAVWPDNRGKHVQAHGGGVIKLGDTWYWFGEDRSQDIPNGTGVVACYSSKDFAHWQFRNRVLTLTGAQAGVEPVILERPKVFYNANTRKFVMYMHIDNGAIPGKGGGYGTARVGIATCDTVDGNYKFLRSFRPLGKESRDIGQFIDDDGKAYLIFESRPSKGFYIAQLSDDYLNVAREVAFIQAPLEGGAIVHYGDLYYVVGSQLTSWGPNPNKYATAKSLSGPWSEFRDIAPPDAKTYGSQSTNLVKIVGSKGTSVIFLGDIWKFTGKSLHDARYLWMPLEIGDGKLWLPEPKPWSIDVQTGEVAIHQNSGLQK